jgi:hypothetical protein
VNVQGECYYEEVKCEFVVPLANPGDDWALDFTSFQRVQTLEFEFIGGNSKKLSAGISLGAFAEGTRNSVLSLEQYKSDFIKWAKSNAIDDTFKSEETIKSEGGIEFEVFSLVHHERMRKSFMKAAFAEQERDGTNYFLLFMLRSNYVTDASYDAVFNQYKDMIRNYK